MTLLKNTHTRALTVSFLFLNRFSLWANQNSFANKVDQVETDGTFHQGLSYLPFSLYVFTYYPICKNGRVKLQIWTDTHQKIRDDGIKSGTTLYSLMDTLFSLMCLIYV